MVALFARLGEMPHPFSVEVRAGLKKPRSLSQNQLIHMWFGEIAKQTHASADQVKRECKFYQGCPILIGEDEQFADFARNLSHLTTEEKIAAMDYVSVTSVMSASQLSRMCDAVSLKYRPQGVNLTDPEALKYRGAA